MESLHLYSFLIHGSFYSLALRLCGVRFRRSNLASGSLNNSKNGRLVPESKMQMGSLALLLAIQLTIMSVHSAAVLASELIKGDGGRNGGNHENEIESTERERRERGQRRNDNEMGLDGNSSSRTANGTVVVVTPGEYIGKPEEKNAEKIRAEESDMNKKQCPLCMDFVRQPAATPCGHVYCWTCVHKWVISDRNGSSNNRNSNNSEDGIKCPVCRQLFQQHQIRALYCYS
jgi:hypothetical protein